MHRRPKSCQVWLVAKYIPSHFLLISSFFGPGMGFFQSLGSTPSISTDSNHLDFLHKTPLCHKTFEHRVCTVVIHEEQTKLPQSNAENARLSGRPWYIIIRWRRWRRLRSMPLRLHQQQNKHANHQQDQQQNDLPLRRLLLVSRCNR